MPESSDAPLVAVGVDGAPAGWVAACLYADSTCRERAAVSPTGLELFAHVDALAAFRDSASDGAAVAIDMPIGLLDEVELRPCDRAARRLLRGRASTVFTPPARYLLPAAGDYRALRALAAERSGSRWTTRSV